MISIRERVEYYLTQRQALGTGLSIGVVKILLTFATFVENQGAQHITADLFLLWKKQYGSANQDSWAIRYSHVRVFTLWLHVLDPKSDVLPEGLISRNRSRPRPYIYSQQEIVKIIDVALQLRSPSGCGLRGPSHATLYGLIAVTGLRISEALHLTDDDVDIQHGTLRVCHAKNHVKRVIPIAPCSVKQLASYRELRERAVVQRDPTFFLGESGLKISYKTVYRTFVQCCVSIGLRDKQHVSKYGKGASIHDLRHSFAVRTLIDWHRKGLDVDREIYKLSNWLGHRSPKETYWYLEAVPELLQITLEKVEQAHKQWRLS